jgi:hypothetical protein
MTQRCRGYVTTPGIQGAHPMAQSVMSNSSGPTTISGPSLFLKYTVTFPFVENRRSHPVQGHCQSFESWVPNNQTLTLAVEISDLSLCCACQDTSSYVIIRQYTSGYVIIRQDTSGYDRIRKNTLVYSWDRRQSCWCDTCRWHVNIYFDEDDCGGCVPFSGLWR